MTTESNDQSQLFGDYYVVPTCSALSQALTLFKRSRRQYNLLRRQTVKLAFWPDKADIDWDWIRGLESSRIGELRISDTIGGFNNLRVIFFKANATIAGDPTKTIGDSLEKVTMQRIWILSVFQKKTQGFSNHLLKAWKGARTIIVKRNYGGLTDP